jgi:hypothetical protein
VVALVGVEALGPDGGMVCLRAGQLGTIQVGAAKVGMAQVCVAQVGALQRGPAEVSPARCVLSRETRRRSAPVRSACSSHTPPSAEPAILAYRNRDPFSRESRSATLRRSTRDKEIAGSSRDRGGVSVVT